MHKKIESELISLAHQILQMKNKHDVLRLRDKARDVYEALSVLAFVDNYFLTTPNVTGNKEEFVAKMKDLVEKSNIAAEKPKSETPKEEVKVEKANIVAEIPEPEKVKEIPKEEVKVVEKEEESAQLIEQTIKTIKSEAKEIVTKIQEQEPKPSSKEMDRQVLASKEQQQGNRKTLEEEMEGSIPVDVAADLFEKAEKVEEQKPVKVERKPEPPKPKLPKVELPKAEVKKQPKEPSKTSLNDQLFKQKLQVGLNDRIAFVKHLFNFSQEEFNRVLSQLNTFETEQDCKDFLNNVVKLEYNWSEKQEYEERLIALIERKFM